MYLYIILCYCLQLMIARRYREMNRENWERVDKDIKTFSKRQNNLLYWAILFTRKQGRLANVALSIFAPVLTKRAGLNCARAEPTLTRLHTLQLFKTFATSCHWFSWL